jgi:hypothetical protein
MQARFMRLNNQAKVGLVTVLCLLGQGYAFTYLLRVEPNPLLSFVPVLPYVAYIYARNKRTWYHHKPLYWMAAVIALTLIDIMPFVYEAMGRTGIN